MPTSHPTRPRGRLTAHAPLDKLVYELSRLGWGELAGREWGAIRNLLRAFVAHDGIHRLSAQGRATIPQLARHAGISERWATDRLAAMVEAGLVDEHVRGGLYPDGTPYPSFVRVNKQALVDMLEAAREIRDEAVRAAWVAMRARMAKLHSIRALYLRRCHERRLRRSPRGEVTARLSPPTGGSSSSPPTSSTSTAPRAWEIPDECEHGGVLGRCPSCRRLNGRRSAAAQTMNAAAELGELLTLEGA